MCGKYIYVRGGNLYTEEGAFRLEILFMLEPWDIDESKFNLVNDILSKQFGKKVSDRDTFWRICNDHIEDNIQERRFDNLQIIYNAMSWLVEREGGDSFPYKQLATRMYLLNYTNEKIIEKVEILATSDSCSSCKKQDGKVLSVDKALKAMPIPNSECTQQPIEHGHGFCSCCYIPVID